jgi:acetyl esterase/lipase
MDDERYIPKTPEGTKNTETVLDRWAPPPTTTLRYADGPDHEVDIWLPAETEGPPALVVVVHGGFWRAGYDRRHTRPQCQGLLAAGYAVAAIEYRRTGMAGGGWPGTFDDVRAALEATPALVAGAFGGDLGPTLLIGHSAGGHLVLWAGSQVAVPGLGLGLGLGLGGIVSLGGVCDLARAHELQLGADRRGGAVDALLGGSPGQVPGRYAAADPMRLPPPPVPVTLIHGTRDGAVPVELSRRYAAHAPEARLVELSGVGHFEPIDPLSPAWGAVLDALEAMDRQ